MIEIQNLFTHQGFWSKGQCMASRDTAEGADKYRLEITSIKLFVINWNTQVLALVYMKMGQDFQIMLQSQPWLQDFFTPSQCQNSSLRGNWWGTDCLGAQYWSKQTVNPNYYKKHHTSEQTAEKLLSLDGNGNQATLGIIKIARNYPGGFEGKENHIRLP